MIDLLSGLARTSPHARLDTISGWSFELRRLLQTGEIDLARVQREPGDGACMPDGKSNWSGLATRRLPTATTRSSELALIALAKKLEPAVRELADFLEANLTALRHDTGRRPVEIPDLDSRPTVAQRKDPVTKIAMALWKTRLRPSGTPVLPEAQLPLLN